MEIDLNEDLIFRHDFHAEDFDEHGNLSLNTIFSAFTTAAVAHADQLGIGNKFIKEHDKLFVIVRMRIDLLRCFVRHQRYTVVTYPTEPSKIQIGREALFLGEDDEVYAKLTSLWVLLDRGKRRITLLTPVIDILSPYLSDLKRAPHLFDESLSALDIELSDLSHHHVYEVTEENIDTNGHMNNAIYAQIIDSIGYTGLIREIEIDFERECMLGESLLTYWQSCDSEMDVIGKKQDDSLSYKARILY